MEIPMQGNNKIISDIDHIQSKGEENVKTATRPLEVTRNNEISKDTIKQLGKKNVDNPKDDLNQVSQINVNIKCIMLIYSEEDTSQNSKIQKYLAVESSIKIIKELKSSIIKPIGLYGISSVMRKFIKKSFGQKVPKLPKAEGVYLYYSLDNPNAIVVFNTPNENQYMDESLSCPKRFVTIIRILSDLCTTIVACISQEMIDNWYYEQEGKMNPYKPKTHKQQQSRIEDQLITESKIEEIKVDFRSSHNLEYLVYKDGNAPIYTLEFKFMSENEQKTVNNALKEFPNATLGVEDPSIFELNVDRLLELIKFGEFNKGDVRFKLKKIFERLKINKEQALRDYIDKIKENLIDKYEFRPSFSKNLGDYRDWMVGELMKIDYKACENLHEEITVRILDKSRLKFELIATPFIKNYFHLFFECKNRKNLRCLIARFWIDMENQFYIESGIPKQIKENIVKSLTSLKSKNFESFMSTILNGINSLILRPKSSKSEEILKNEFNLYKSSLINQKNEFQQKCKLILNPLKSDVSLTQLTILKTEYSIVGEEIEHICKFEDQKHLLNKIINFKNFSVSQIISLDAGANFVLLKNLDKKETFLLRFKSEISNQGDYEICESIQDLDVKLAWGSTSSKYILFENTKKRVSQCSLRLNKYIQNGIDLDVYSVVKSVLCGYYLNYKRELLIIDTEGSLYRIDTVYAKSKVQIAKAPGKPNGLKPSKGSKFLDIDVSKDENVLFLMNEVSIEFYDKNFVLTNSIDLSKDFLAFKCVNFDSQCYLLIQNSKSPIKCFKITSPQQKTIIFNISKKIDTVKGNPIFDIHHQGFIKFGPIIEETQIIKSERELGYYTLSGENQKIKNYIIGLASIKSCFNKLIFANPINIFIKLKNVKVSEFHFTLCTRIPLQIAALQNSLLVPLKDGINNYEELCRIDGEKLLENLSQYIRFDNYEDIINALTDIMVISIIGKQSSGKSYLLNRLAGTRFDVAAERCTQGIWMGLGYIDDTPIIVFDCEGLFTIERSSDEEIKLCLFISSLSDIVILNSDLASGKHIKLLFDEFAEGVNKLSGSNLFKGYLDIAYRDIPNNQEDGAKKEFLNFLNNLNETGKKETLSRLFNLEVLNSMYHHFEINEFNDEVQKRRIEYTELVKKKWSKGKDFSFTMKTILAQLYLNKTTNIDIHIFNTKSKELKENIEKMMANPTALKEFLSPEVYKSTITLGSEVIQVNWSINDFSISDKDALKFFKDPIFTPKNECLFRKFHNDLFTELKKNIEKFFELRKTLMLNYLKVNLPNYHEFRDQVDIQSDIERLEARLDRFSESFKICLRNCEKCGFYCKKILNHQDNHDCGTDHKCLEFCSICGQGFNCILPNEHKDLHECSKKDHKCIGACKLRNCKNSCELNLHHEGDCRCKGTHECLNNCEMYSLCNKTCKIGSTVDHNRHSCEGRCMFKCAFDDGNNCSSLNHFHDNDLVEEKSNELGNIKRHLCGIAHDCKGICSSQGNCEILRKDVEKTYQNRFNSHTYSYVEIYTNRLNCKENIPAGELSHKNTSHLCSSKTHYCLSTCPDCLSPCTKAFGHSGLHSSEYHRNKENSLYISKQETFKFTDELTRQELTLIPGESAIIETCNAYCAKKGHGHTHPIPCRGNNECLQKKIPGHAVHSDSIFKVSSNQLVFDFVSCSEYWKYFNWEHPSSKSAEMLEIFRKCNFYCNHPSHPLQQPKNYCEHGLFHSNSINLRDHQFRCNHPGNDIVFISDCTGSMNPHFPNVKKLITDFISRWGNENTKFAFVGYSDHPPHNGAFPATNPICVFPSSKDLNDGNAAEVSNFVNGVNTCIEGSNQGEAMIDGLSQAIKLNFQEGSYKTFILFADESPHGREFNSSSGYPEGCPCGLDWRDLLKSMKGRNIEFILVKLSDMLNKTLELFRAEYNSVRSMSINEFPALELECFAKVRKDEESYFVLSKV